MRDFDPPDGCGGHRMTIYAWAAALVP